MHFDWRSSEGRKWPNDFDDKNGVHWTLGTVRERTCNQRGTCHIQSLRRG